MSPIPDWFFNHHTGLFASARVQRKPQYQSAQNTWIELNLLFLSHYRLSKLKLWFEKSSACHKSETVFRIIKLLVSIPGQASEVTARGNIGKLHGMSFLPHQKRVYTDELWCPSNGINY